jgi:SAM-dependent methyltransferase
MNTSSSQVPEYVLGHSEDEFVRLSRQARILDAFSEPLLRRAGIEPGMHVLDVGCAAGDLSFLAANLVGASGQVVGVDRSSDALATARARSQRIGQTNAEFVQCDLTTDELGLPERLFDAVVGRAVLYVLQDPVRLLRRLPRYLRPGGLLVFHEPSIGAVGQAWPSMKLWQTVGRWWWEGNQKAGIHSQVGLKLHGMFVEAGLPAPQLQHDFCLDGGADSLFYDWIAATTRSALPALERLGVATADEVGIETLADRLRAEAIGSGAVLLVMSLIGAWARTKPA